MVEIYNHGCNKIDIIDYYNIIIVINVTTLGLSHIA